MSKNFFTIDDSPPGYGVRVFVNNLCLTSEIIETINKLSSWGSSDKEFTYKKGTFSGWEFPHPKRESTYSEDRKRQASAVAYLESLGFKRVDQKTLDS